MALQLFGYIMSITGLCGLIIGTFTNEWKITGHDNDQTVVTYQYEGLWKICKVTSSSTETCINYTSLLHQTFEVRLGQVMMIISIAFASLAALAAVSGLRCTRCLEEKEPLKNRAAFAGGILSVCSGLVALGITSWFMYEIVDDFFRKTGRDERYVIGRSLIGALVGSLLCLLGGLLLFASSVTHLRSNEILSTHKISKNPGKDYV